MLTEAARSSRPRLGKSKNRKPIGPSRVVDVLGEHMQLVIDAMGAALRGGPEFRADAAQVNGNTTQLAGAFGVLFGPQSGAAFTRVWGEHVDALVSYSGAVATKNRKAEAKARAQLRAFEHHLSRFLSTSTDGRWPDTGAESLSEQTKRLPLRTISR